MKSIFLLHIRQIFRENDWILPLLLLVVASIVGSSLAPSNEDPTLRFSARTQTIVMAFILAITNLLDVAPAFTCGLLMNLYGLYGLGAVDQVRSGKNPFLSK